MEIDIELNDITNQIILHLQKICAVMDFFFFRFGSLLCKRLPTTPHTACEIFLGGFYPLARNYPEPKHFWIDSKMQIQISLTRAWQFDAIVTCTTSRGVGWLHLRAILTHWHPFSDLLCFHNLCTYTTARCCIKDQMTYQSYRSPESVLFICLSEDSIGNQCTVSLILLIDWL